MKKLFKTLLLSVLLLLGAADAMAQFTNGKVYRIVCSGSPSVSLGASALSDVAALSTSETDRAQQWYVTGSNGKYTFRNLANGRYLLGHKDYSNEWRLTEESNEFTVDQVNGNYAIYQTSHGTYYTYMHKDGSNNIVSWESSAANSQWTPYEVSYTAAELQAIWNEVESFILTEDAVKGYEEKLMAIFTDKACTQLNSTYASKSVSQIEADANYQALPAVLQAMVLKVKNNDWSEANAVSSKPQWGGDYAKKFRVQMYEPYSIEGEITSYLRINAHCNMDNPTGLYANSGKAMYIMVEGEIKEGAELWVAYQTGLGATNYYNNASYTQLREGLNVVPYFYDTSSLWINYVVHTYNSDGTTIDEKFPHKLSDYKPLKIHIEGGYINGYYNAIGDFRAADSGTENLWGDVDNDDDWNYYMERAPLDGNDGRPNRDFPLLAHRQTLLFPLAPVVDDGGVTRAGLYHRIANIEVPSVPNCYGGSGNTFGTFDGSYPGMGLSTSNGKINIMLEAWDRIMYSQLASMGVVSKSTMDKMNALYPRWTSAGTTAEIYDYNNKSSLDNKTYLEFCNGIDYSEYFNHHGCGVGWPNGYMSGGWRVTAYHYETMEGIIGTMASSSGSTWGPAHEIGHQHQSIINLEGQTEVTNNLFSNIAVWYMGMATSRYDGSQGSLESVLGAFTTEGSDLYANNIWALTHLYYRLWLYYHLAGNNTQFWPRLFELCRQVPLENHPNGTNDGSTTLLRFYQHACDAAGEDLTEFFRAHGYFEVMDNRVVGDYYGATYNQSQAQIDEAIASVKAKNYPANYAVLLINDGTSETTFKHNGATRRGLWDGYATAEFGSVNDFISGDADVTTNYEASLDSDGSITMTGGEGGIGFLMFNEDGELVAFSNKSTFKLGKEAKELYQNGQARIVVVNADNEIIELGEEIVPEPEDPAISAKKAELQALIDATRGLVATVADVSAAVDAAVDLRGKLYAERPYTAGGTNHSDYSSVENNYNLLDNRVDTHFHSDYNYSTMVSPPYIRVDLGEGESAAKFKFNYTTRNASGCAPTKINVYAGNEQTLNGTPIATFTINDSENPLPTATSTSWTSRDIECGTACRYFKFEVVESQGSKTENGVKKYYFVMSEFGFNKVSDAVITIKDEYKDSKVTEELLVATNNAVVDAQKVKDKTSSSIALLEAQIAALQAAKTALEEAMGNNTPTTIDKSALVALIGNVNSLLATIAEDGVSRLPIPLQADNGDNPYFIWCNKPAGDSNGVAGLIDKNTDGTGNTDTFLGTDWSGDVPAYTHYIEIDLGVDNAINRLSMDYITRNSTHSDQRPNAIKILGSNDMEHYTTITEITEGLASGQCEQWSMSTPLDLGADYRYIRIAVGSERGFFHMSDFNLYAVSDKKLKEYYSTATALDYASLCLALQSAEHAVNRDDLTEAQCIAVYEKLNDCYTTVNDILSLDYDGSRDELSSLIADAQKLLNEVSSGVVSAEETAIPLQCDNANAPYYIFCNAPEKSDLYPGDNLGVAALLDMIDGEPNTTTHLHTTYTGNDQYDDLDHYLRVDMGEGESRLLSFKFAFLPRSNSGNAPKVILVEGCNDLEKGVFEEIATLTDLTVRYQSGEITNGKAYRYIRFMVKETVNNDMYNGHPYFSLTHFEMTACKRVSVKDGFGVNLTPGLVVAAHVEKEQAESVCGYYTSEDSYNTALSELQVAYDALNAAKLAKDIPVILTTDVNNPVLYKIKINRGGDKCLQYDEVSGKVDVSDVRLNRAQAWYFMSGDGAKEDILIVPYKDDKKVLATNSFGEGAGKVDAVEKGTAGYSYNWNITKVADSEWYNITIPDGNETTFYFSNYGGVSEKMGFYNDSSDGGSQFQFVFDETDYSLPDSYYELYNLHQDCGGEKTSGENIGQYSSSTAQQFNDIRSAVKTILEKAELSDEEYTEKYNELLNAFNALEVNLPVEGAYYRIRSANSNAYSNGHLVYVNSENKPHFASPSDENLSEFIWQFEQIDGDLCLKNLHTQCYVNSAPWATQVVLAASPQKITIDVLDNGANGQVRLNVSGSYPLHAQASESMLVGYTGDAGSASAWYIEEVADVAAVHYPYTLSAIGYGTLMLGFDAVIPEGIEAYWAESVNGIYIHMEPISDVIPANTAVILKRNEALPAEALSVTFKHSTVAGTAVKDNMLAGTLYKRVVKCDTDDVDNKVYVMQAKNGEVKMYWAYENYGADGKRDDTNDGQNDNGGHIMNSANRAYLVVPQVQAQQSALNLRFGAFTDVETAEDDCESVEAIYDLQGRKVANPTKGIYIINGRKVVVK